MLCMMCGAIEDVGMNFRESKSSIMQQQGWMEERIVGGSGRDYSLCMQVSRLVSAIYDVRINFRE